MHGLHEGREVQILENVRGLQLVSTTHQKVNNVPLNAARLC